MAFHEDFFPPAKRTALAKLCQLTKAQGTVVEVGCWEGRSTIVLANHFPRVHAIDHWSKEWRLWAFRQGDWPDPALQHARNGERDVFVDFKENLIQAGVFNNVTIHRTGWRQVDWEKLAPIAFLFIDGEHSYEEVKDNIQVARPLMAKGGIMAGDDYNWEEVRQALRAEFGPTTARTQPMLMQRKGVADLWAAQF